MSEYPKKLYAVIDGEDFEATAENDAEEWNLSRSGYLPKEEKKLRKPAPVDQVEV